MQFFVSLYDFKDGAPGDADGRARLLEDLPGVQMILSGRIRSGLDSFGRGRQIAERPSVPVPTYGELTVFKNDTDAEHAFSSRSGHALRSSNEAELVNLKTYAAHGAAIVPFDSRSPGARCFVALAGFVLDPSFGSVDKAEHHYATVHTRICARLPGCQGYLGGIVENRADAPTEPYRLAISIFRDEDSLRAALKSTVAQAIEQDARGFSKIAMLFFFDATVRL